MPIVTPSYSIPLRHRDDFQSGNFSRFPEIWLILIGIPYYLSSNFVKINLANLQGENDVYLKHLDLVFGSPAEVEELQRLSVADQLLLCTYFYKKKFF